jgi:hypothetical protein
MPSRATTSSKTSPDASEQVRDALRRTLAHAIAAGECLLVAKGRLGHGHFLAGSEAPACPRGPRAVTCTSPATRSW